MQPKTFVSLLCAFFTCPLKYLCIYVRTPHKPYCTLSNSQLYLYSIFGRYLQDVCEVIQLKRQECRVLDHRDLTLLPFQCTLFLSPQHVIFARFWLVFSCYKECSYILLRRDLWFFIFFAIQYKRVCISSVLYSALFLAHASKVLASKNAC